MLHSSLLKAIAYCHVFSEGCACDVYDRPRLPSPSLGSHFDYSPTVPDAHSLRPLVPSSSLIRSEPVQVYCHECLPKVLLDTAYNTIYPGNYPVWALSWGLETGRFLLRAGRVIEQQLVALVETPAQLAKSALTSFHPVTGQLQVSAGIIVDIV
jgi:hypothetical protein